MKIYCFLFFVFASIAVSHSAKEVLEERFKKYDRNPSVYGKNQQETIYANEETATIYSPLVDRSTIIIKPRPKKVQEALNNPGKFFKRDAEKALNDFRKFAKEYRSCVEKKKWPDNLDCISKFEICFGEDSSRYVCDFESLLVDFSGLENERLKNSFKRSEKVFDLFNKCFDETALVELTFEIFGEEASRRNYYTLDSHYYTHKLGGIRCRFTVMEGSGYRLVALSKHELGRPEVSMVPLDLYVKDHYEDLLDEQRKEKALELKKTKSKTTKKYQNEGE